MPILKLLHAKLVLDISYFKHQLHHNCVLFRYKMNVTIKIWYTRYARIPSLRERKYIVRLCTEQCTNVTTRFMNADMVVSVGVVCD